MRRRDFIVGAGAAGVLSVTRPRVALAQQSRRQVIGFLSGQPLGARPHLLAAFHKGLGEEGLVEGKNIQLVYRSADGRPERLPELAAALVRSKVDIIVATGGGTAVALAAKKQTDSIPIVFTTGTDPVIAGLVPALHRPGGNVTGVSFLINELVAKRLELLSELVPHTGMIVALVNPRTASSARQTAEIEAAAMKLRLKVEFLTASTEAEIDAAFAELSAMKADAILVSADPFYNSRRHQITSLAARSGIPASYFLREFVEAGGLMSYGTNQTAVYRLAGTYVGLILKGAKPGDLPVQQSTRFELMLNLRTAKALGIEFPATLLAIADEVIE